MKIQKPETKASIQLKNIISFIIIVGLTAALCTVLFQHGAHTENLLLIMLVGILTVVIQTKNFLYTIVSSVVLIIFYDYFFVYPYESLHHISKNYVLTTFIFLLVALITNALVIRLQRQIDKSKRSEELNMRLYKASNQLLRKQGRSNILEYAQQSLTELAGADVKIYCDITGKEDNDALVWCYRNSAECGRGENEFSSAGYKYIPFRSRRKTIGVVAVDCNKKMLTKETKECILSVLSQVAMALERDNLDRIAREKAAASGNAGNS
jgi:two-component system sensor histidine kinase KdpD